MAAAARKAWATKRDRYGPTGMSAETTAIFRLAMEDRLATEGHYLSRRTHCSRGHLFSPQNIRWDNGFRTRRCRTCLAMSRTGRPQWVERDGVKVSVRAHDLFFHKQCETLRQRMLAAHPDKGGTANRFIAARRRLARFAEDEARWYRLHGLSMPTPRRRRRSKQRKEGS